MLSSHTTTLFCFSTQLWHAKIFSFFIAKRAAYGIREKINKKRLRFLAFEYIARTTTLTILLVLCEKHFYHFISQRNFACPYLWKKDLKDNP
jgi:hypothetical protein